VIGQWLKKLEKNPSMAVLLQFVKFGLVGISNTAISYTIELLCYYLLFSNHSWGQNVRIVLTSILAFFVSVTNSYYWNQRHVFGSNKKKTFVQHLCTYLKTVVCYGLTGLILSPWVKTILVNKGMAFWLATLLVLLFTIPLNFLMNKLWAFRSSSK